MLLEVGIQWKGRILKGAWPGMGVEHACFTGACVTATARTGGRAAAAASRTAIEDRIR